MHYVVIGGTGFLGQHLLHMLLREHPAHQEKVLIEVIDKTPSLEKTTLLYPDDFKDPRVVLHLNTDIAHDESLKGMFEGADTIFHLASLIAYGRKNKKPLYETNVLGVNHVIQQAKASHVKKIIYVSSFATIGYLNNREKTQLATEDCKNNWDQEKFCYYGISKFYGEKLIMQAASDAMHVAIAIPGIMLGPGPGHHASFLPFQIALKKNWAVIPQGGTNVIDVRDVAQGLIALSKHDVLCDKYLLVAHNLEHRDLLSRIAAVCQRKLKLIEIPTYLAPFFMQILACLEWFLSAKSPYSKEGALKASKYRYFSNQKAMREIKWTPHYTLDETLQDTYAWIQKNKS